MQFSPIKRQVRSTAFLPALVVGVALLLATPSQAQDAIAVEVEGGGSVGAYENAQAGIDPWKPQPSLGVTLDLALFSHFGVYGSYDRSGFVCKEGRCSQVVFTSTGYSAGVRFESGLLWFRGGAVFHRLEVVRESSERLYDRRWEPARGYESSLGFDFPLTSWLSITPGVSYTRYAVQVEGEDDESSAVVVIAGRFGLRVDL